MPGLAQNHAGIGRQGRKPGTGRRFHLPRFAGRMSQPLLRLVGLWQEFQQASIAVKRLGDILDFPDIPQAPQALTPSSEGYGPRVLVRHGLAFRDGEHLPWLYKNLDLAFQPGRLTVLMGPSGCGEGRNWGLSPIFPPSGAAGLPSWCVPRRVSDSIPASAGDRKASRTTISRQWLDKKTLGSEGKGKHENANSKKINCL